MEFCDTKILLASKDASANFEAFKQNSEFCDVSLQSGDAVVKAHRVVLAAASPYFEAMFNTDFEKSDTNLVNVPSISPELLPLLVDFIYTGRITTKYSTVQELIAAARMLYLEDLVTGCFRSLKIHMNTCNALRTLSIAETFDCSEPTEHTLAYIGAHWSTVSQGKEFLELSLALFIKILSSDKFVVDHELEVVCGVVRWLEHSPDARTQHCAELVRHLRLGRVPGHVLAHLWSNVTDPQLAEQLRLCSEKTTAVANVRARGKCFFYVVGTFHNNKGLSPVFRYDIYKKVWKHVVPMETQRSYPGVAALGGRLYVVGGEPCVIDYDRCPEKLTSGEVYDPATGKWSPIAAMNKARSRLGLVALNGKLYALGGLGHTGYVSNIEEYDPAADKWTPVGDLPQRVYGSCPASYNGAVYIMDRPMRRYEPTAGPGTQWRICGNTQDRFFRNTTCAVLDGHLYVWGRSYEPEAPTDNFIQRYSSITDWWEWVAPIPLSGRSYTLGAGDGVLLVTGGGTLDLYEPAKDRWTRGPDPPLHCDELRSAVL